MKSILFLVVLSIGFSSEVISLKEKINKTDMTTLPFELTTSSRRSLPGFAVNSELSPEISFYAYTDLGLKKRIKYDDVTCSIFKRFDTGNRNFMLLDLWIDMGENYRHLLVTLNNNYQIVDTLEVAVGGSFDNFTYTKQYHLDNNLGLTVYWLQPLSESPVYFRPDTSPFEAKRVDYRYHIDDNGKFVIDDEILYKSQIYDPADISSNGKNIWDGKEEKINN